MTIGFGASGSADLYGRMIGRYLMRYLPGQPSLIVLNQLGAGGVVALNDWSNKAEPNGLFNTIGAESQTDPYALIRTHAKFDPATFEYVGGLAASSQGLFVNKVAVARLYDKSAKPVIMGMVGSTLRSGNYQVLWGAAFAGWNVKWVRGYTSTAELRQAAERGEVDMSTFGSTNDIAYLRGTGKFVVVSQSRHPARNARRSADHRRNGQGQDRRSAGASGVSVRSGQSGWNVAGTAAANAGPDRRRLFQSLRGHGRPIHPISEKKNSARLDPVLTRSNPSRPGKARPPTRQGLARGLGFHPD